MAPSATELAATKHPLFDAAVNESTISRNDLNWVILDYLVTEGFAEAAEKFATEARMKHALPRRQIANERTRIRSAICAGQPGEAVALINSSFPDFLDENSYLHFGLLRAELIELIRACFDSPEADITIPIQFATENLVPLALKDERCLADMEQAMSLLLFGKKGPPPGALPGVSLDPVSRVELADSVNEAILGSLSMRQRPRIMDLLKTRIWAERTARSHHLSVPSRVPLAADEHFGADNQMPST